MARRYRDPWAKKSKKGMKSLGTMAKVGGVLGYAAYNSIKSTNAQTRHLNQATKTKNISPKGWHYCDWFYIGSYNWHLRWKFYGFWNNLFGYGFRSINYDYCII